MAAKIKRGLRIGIEAFCEYDTPQVLHIRSKTVGIINRLIQLAVIGYIIGYVIAYKKGYQEFDMIESVATTKVKGVVFTNFTDKSGNYEILNKRIWDVADYVVPPQEPDNFFVTTNLVVTTAQNQSTCDEDPALGTCESDSDCIEGESGINSNGVNTGKCIDSTRQNGTKVCEIHAWCPLENDEHLLKRNIDSVANETYMKRCIYNSSDKIDRFCPIFQLGDMVKEAGENYTDLAYKGGIIAISIHWDCNLDHGISECTPIYKFRRLDHKNVTIAKGWNFRYANYYHEEGLLKRDLFKAYGIRFVIKVTGKAGKFNMVPLLINIGSGIGLLAFARILSDIIALYLLSKKEVYRKAKYNVFTDTDAFVGKFLRTKPPTSSDPEQPPNDNDMSLVAQNLNAKSGSHDSIHIQIEDNVFEIKKKEKINSDPGECTRHI